MTGHPVTCPGCATEYLLPESLMGEGGARITCPACGRPFAVSREGAGLRAPEAAAAEAAPAAKDARAIARDVLDELVARLGPSLTEAVHERRLFASHGTDLFGAFDEFRRRVGSGAATQAFREELHERWGVDLFPPANRAADGPTVLA